MKLESLIEGKKLAIFDFDDTLVKSKSRVHLTTKDGRKKALTPAEFAVYKPKPGDEFDFHEFGKLIGAEAITHMVHKFQRAVASASAGHRRTEILTARRTAKPVDQWLETMGIKKIPVKALGDSDPNVKAEYIEKFIQHGFDDILFFDDSYKNIRAVEKLKSKYPKIKLKTELVKL